MSLPTKEGIINIPEGKIWYLIVGSGDQIPILTLHGGPGAGHDYLESFEKLASKDRRVIFYDQLGCGKSDLPNDKSLWHIDRSVQEVNLVRQALKLDQIHLIGQSWGGWLSIEYMLSQPTGVQSLVLASTSASIPEFVEEANKLKALLPKETRDTLEYYESKQDYHNPKYEEAVMEFYKRHVCRMDVWPDCIMRTIDNLDRNQVYETMNGPNEFTVIGNLKNWNRINRLGEINTPTLITVGKYDEITPKCSQTIHNGIKNSQMHIFQKSGHTAHLEEMEEYMEIVKKFITKNE